MNKYNLEEITSECKENPELILWLDITNQYNSLETIYKYKIYGELLTNLLKLCNDDYDMLITSLNIINDRKYIEKNIVHDNLKMKNPIPFSRKIAPTQDDRQKKIFYFFEGHNFYKKYMAVKYPTNKKSR